MKVRDLMTEQVPNCLAFDMASQAARVMMDLGGRRGRPDC